MTQYTAIFANHLPTNSGVKGLLNSQVMLNSLIQHSRNSEIQFPTIPSLYFSSAHTDTSKESFTITISTASSISDSVISSPSNNLGNPCPKLFESSNEFKSNTGFFEYTVSPPQTTLA